MAWARAALLLGAAGVLLSGGSPVDSRTPPPLPGLPPPFLGTSVVGAGAVTAAIDSYGDVVDLRPGPLARAAVEVSSRRQRAGTVAADSALVPRFGRPGSVRPLWRAARVGQRFLPGTNVLRTGANLAGLGLTVVDAGGGSGLAREMLLRGDRGERLELSLDLGPLPSGACTADPDARRTPTEAGREALVWRGRGELRVSVVCPRRTGQSAGGASARRIIARIARADRRWLASGRPLGRAAPSWAKRMYGRSLLVLRALSDRGGGFAAGIREGWAQVWPRDAAAAAIALAAAGHLAQARLGARFLSRLDLGAAARFDGDGSPVPGRGPQGDAAGWVRAAMRFARQAHVGTGRERARQVHAGTPGERREPGRGWRGLPDYREHDGDRGSYLANAIASGAPAERIRALFGASTGLNREAGGGPGHVDSAAAWALLPFPRPRLRSVVDRSLLRLAASAGPFGITPGEDWSDADPWSAPTAWTALALARLGRRRAAVSLLAALRRAATPTGSLPERVGYSGGLPRSTTPLGWSHAFAVLALRELWPSR